MSEIIQTYNKGAYIAPEGDDLTKITALIEQSLRNNGGRPACYANTPEGLQTFTAKATDYFAYLRTANEDIEDKRIVPDIENFCVYMGLTRRTLLEYQKTRGQEWEQAILFIKDSIFACKKQLASVGRMPPIVFVFDAVNNFGYHSTNEFHITTEAPQKEDAPKIDTNQIATLIEDTSTAPQLPQLPE